MSNINEGPELQLPQSGNGAKISRAALQSIAGAIPFVGGVVSAAAGAWSEHEQDKINDFLHNYMLMMREELEEKHRTMADILVRLDIQDEKISKRVETKEYQSLVRKAFRDWAGAESQKKREFIRNVLVNAASTDLTSDDVVRLFLDWLYRYSEFHLSVVAQIYRQPGQTRLKIWNGLGREPVREDSAEADLFRLLIRELSMGGIIRQHAETDSQGNFIKAQPKKGSFGVDSHKKVSTFEDDKQYFLTELGSQFVHYTMTDVPQKISYNAQQEQPNAA